MKKAPFKMKGYSYPGTSPAKYEIDADEFGERKKKEKSQNLELGDELGSSKKKGVTTGNPAADKAISVAGNLIGKALKARASVNAYDNNIDFDTFQGDASA